MAGQAANQALAAISVNLHPGNWEKTEHADENLRSFNQWFEKYRRWTNVCLRGVPMDDSMKWDMLVAAAGNDLHDIMLESGIVTELRQAANEIPYAPYQPLVPEVPAGEDGNDITQRNTLMTGMPASNFDSWRIWGLQLKEQSQRCKWGAEYTWEVAALDALLYQCPDPHWKSKILGNPQWKFQEALDYGIRTLTSKQQGQKLGAAAKSETREELPVDRVTDTKSAKDYFCNRCKTKHGFASCLAYGKVCGTCGKKGHFPGTTVCKGSRQGAPPQRGGGQTRGRGSGKTQGQGRANQNQAGPPQSTSKTVFRKEEAHWVKKRQTVNYVKETVPTDEDSEGDFEYDCDRVLDVLSVGVNQSPTTVRIKPIQDADYLTKVPWTTDSGVRKTLLAEKHYWKIRSHNPDMKLRHTNIRFKPYSTDTTVPLLGCMDVKLTNNKGKSIKTKVYVTEGQTESLLGKEDGIALGILKINPDGDEPDEKDEKV